MKKSIIYILDLRFLIIQLKIYNLCTILLKQKSQMTIELKLKKFVECINVKQTNTSSAYLFGSKKYIDSKILTINEIIHRIFMNIR